MNYYSKPSFCHFRNGDICMVNPRFKHLCRLLKIYLTTTILQSRFYRASRSVNAYYSCSQRPIDCQREYPICGYVQGIWPSSMSISIRWSREIDRASKTHDSVMNTETSTTMIMAPILMDLPLFFPLCQHTGGVNTGRFSVHASSTVKIRFFLAQ